MKKTRLKKLRKPEIQTVWLAVSIVLGVAYLNALNDICVTLQANYFLFIIPALMPMVTYAFIVSGKGNNK